MWKLERAAVLSGIIAGIVFIVLEMILWPVAGLGSPWTPVRMIAAILQGPGVLPPPDTFHAGIFLTAMLVHFSLSILYATICAVFHYWLLKSRFRRLSSMTHGLFGLFIYIVNFYGFVVLFPWFTEARHEASILVHVVWGMVLPLAYEERLVRRGIDPAGADGSGNSRAVPGIDIEMDRRRASADQAAVDQMTLEQSTSGGAGQDSPIRTPRKPAFAREALPHMAAVYRYALRLSQGNTHEAEDIVQEVFLRAYRSWESYDARTNCLAWLFTICRNRYLRMKERPNERQEVVGGESDADLGAMGATPEFGELELNAGEKEFFASFVDDEVMRAVDVLPEAFREVVVLCDLEGLSYSEVSEVLAVPVATVRSRLYRGRRLLQQALYDYALRMGYGRPEERE